MSRGADRGKGAIATRRAVWCISPGLRRGLTHPAVHAATESALPDAVLIAGANGAGKTTFARNLLPLSHPACVFLNADEIQREPAFAAPAAAGRELLRRLDAHVAQSADFAIETTLSSMMYARRIPAWRRAGYAITLYFLEVATADLAVARVAQRVAAGGHGIPDADIRRRHARGLALLPTYRGLADIWYRYRVDAGGQILVDQSPP